MNTKHALLDEHALEELDDRHALMKVLTDPLQLGLLLGVMLGAFWATRKTPLATSSSHLPIAPGSLELGR